MHEVAHHTWPECYPAGTRRDIVRHIVFHRTITLWGIHSERIGFQPSSVDINTA